MTYKFKDPKLARAAQQQKQKSKPRGYRYRMAYEVVTEESAESGEADQQGWEVPQSEVFATLDELLREVSHKANWLEWSSSHPGPRDWLISEADQDMRTGASTSYSLWIEHADGSALTASELNRVNESLLH